MRPRAQPNADEAELARSFEALANPVRLALLRDLRSPKPLADVRVAPGEGEGSALARQSVRRHLDRLLESRLLVAHERDGSLEYGLNHQGLFALAEEALTLCGLRPEIEPDVETEDAQMHAGALGSGACLVLVHGASIGQVFPLAGAKAWRIGRHRDQEVALDFDPFVSGEHARLEAVGGAHDLVDIATARNRTSHNLRPLAPGARVKLRHGDLVGVGRSLLLYRAA